MSIFETLYARGGRKFRLGAAPALAASCLLAPAPLAAGEATAAPAELVLRNGRIETMDAVRSRATAIAVRDGRIVWVGFDDGVSRWVGPGTRLVDLGGRYVVPGFQDSHVHPVTSGVELVGCNLFESRSSNHLLERIAACAEGAPGAGWLVGYGWDLALFPGGSPHRTALDDIAPRRPVFLLDAFEHSAWVNSRALELAGITASTPDPPGGRIERDDDGTPSGVLHESAAVRLVRRHVPPPSTAQREAGLRLAVEMAHRHGITGVYDPKCGAEELAAYAALDRAGELALHVSTAAKLEPDRGLEQLDELARLRAADWGPHVHAGAAKIFVDGVIETQTAALLAPYVGHGDDRGELLWSADHLRAIAIAADRRGLQLHFHAIGDRAIQVALDAIEAVESAEGRRDRRPTLAHIQLFAPEDVPRFRRLGVAASFQPLWAYDDVYIRDLTVPFLGPERSRWLYPIGSVARTGAILASGSDWSVSSMNPLAGIETAITRRDPSAESGPPWIPQETVDLPTILASYTIGSAWAAFRDHETGSLEAGKLADLVVLDRDLFEIPATEISDAEVLVTLFAGELVYRDPELPPDELSFPPPAPRAARKDPDDG